MNIYSDKIDSWEKISDALTREKDAGRIARHVTFEVLREFRAQKSRFGYRLKLSAAVRDSGRRWGNSGGYGATSGTTGDYAATYDEWGWLISALYDLDDYMIVAFNPKNPVYADRWDFEEKTGGTYTREQLLHQLDERDELEQLKKSFLAGDTYLRVGDPYPFQVGRGGKGREGSGREDGDQGRLRYWRAEELNAAIKKWAEGKKTGNDYVRFVPRSREGYAEFAHIPSGVPATQEGRTLGDLYV